MLYFLQLIRFIAANLVLLYHLSLFDSGYKGVDLFFVISGFVMYYTLYTRTKPSAFKFIINRITKIFFLYWVAIVALYFILPSNTAFFNLKTILLFPGHSPVLGVSWSLSYELYFYFLIWIAVYLLPSRYHFFIFFTFLTLTTAVTFINLTEYTLKGSIWNFLIGQNLWQFLLGLVSGYFFTNKSVPSKPALVIVISSSLLFLVINIPFDTPISYLIYGPIAFTIVWLISSFEKSFTFYKKPGEIIKVLGEASYAIYLFGPIITLLIGPDTPTNIFLIIVATITFSILFNRMVESPFLRWCRNLIFQNVEQRISKKS
ncbi:MAG: acyltransferase [Ginsengibacter sp.]